MIEIYVCICICFEEFNQGFVHILEKIILFWGQIWSLPGGEVTVANIGPRDMSIFISSYIYLHFYICSD